MLDGEVAGPHPRVRGVLQPAIAGSKASVRPSRVWPHTKVVLKVGSYAIGGQKLRQVRKEAAVTVLSYVPWDCLAGANCVPWVGSVGRSMGDARPPFYSQWR